MSLYETDTCGIQNYSFIHEVSRVYAQTDASSHDSRRPSREIKQTRPNKLLKIPLSFKIRDINNICFYRGLRIHIRRKHFHLSF